MVRILAFTAVLFGLAGQSSAGVVATVSGRNSVYFAGQELPISLPSGVVEDDFYGDLAFDDLIPTQVDLSSFSGPLAFRATGQWAHGTRAPETVGPEGRSLIERTFFQYSVFGVGRLEAGLATLAGVFTTDLGPLVWAAPAGLSIGDDMTHPPLNQAFAIGAALDGVEIPAGATKLFLGMHDSFGWYNNSGEIQVEISQVPEPSAWLLLGFVVVVATVGRRRPGYSQR